MAFTREDVIQKGNEIVLKELERGVKNKWQWKWLDIVVRSDKKVRIECQS